MAIVLLLPKHSYTCRRPAFSVAMAPPRHRLAIIASTRAINSAACPRAYATMWVPHSAPSPMPQKAVAYPLYSSYPSQAIASPLASLFVAPSYRLDATTPRSTPVCSHRSIEQRMPPMATLHPRLAHVDSTTLIPGLATHLRMLRIEATTHAHMVFALYPSTQTCHTYTRAP